MSISGAQDTSENLRRLTKLTHNLLLPEHILLFGAMSLYFQLLREFLPPEAQSEVSYLLVSLLLTQFNHQMEAEQHIVPSWVSCFRGFTPMIGSKSMIKIKVAEKTGSAVLILMKFKVSLSFLPLLLPAAPELL